MKKRVEQAKTAKYMEFVDEIDKMPASAAVTRVLKMAKAIRQREVLNSNNGAALDPSAFSAHIANQCTKTNPWNWTPKKVDTPWDFMNDIESAINCSKSNKAAGLDRVNNEILKVDREISARLIMCMWRACCRL